LPIVKRTSTPPRTKSLARFCLSSCITVGCWAVWLVLGISLAALSYVAVARDLPVPDFVLRRVEAGLRESGFDLQFGRARFDPTGKVLLEDVQLRARQFDDPLLTCRLLYVRHDPWSLLAGRAQTAEIRVEGAALFVPAMLSPSGTAEPLVRGLAASLRYADGLWHMDQLAGNVGSLRLTAVGQVALRPTRPDARGRISLEELTERYLKAIREITPWLQRLESFDSPALAVRLEPELARLEITGKGIRQPWGQPFVTGPFTLRTTVPLDRPVGPLVLQAAARDIVVRDQVRAGVVTAELALAVRPDRKRVDVDSIRVAVDGIRVAGEAVTAILGNADLSHWPEIRGEAQAEVDGEFLAVAGDVNLPERRARVRAEGRVAPGLIARTLGRLTPRAAPYFAFEDPVWFRGEAVFAPGWKFRSLSSRVDAGRLDSRGVGVTAARGRIEIDGTSFLAHEAYAAIGPSQARGSYWMDFATTDYRMLLLGRLRPLEISGWFRGDWWPRFWNRYFSFPEAPPEADVDIQGRWREPRLSNNFIRARANQATVWHGDFEQVAATIFVRPNFVHGWSLEARRKAGREAASGWFKRFAPTQGGGTGRVEFDFQGNPEPGVIGRMVEGKTDDVFSPLQLTQPPHIHAWGVVDEGKPDFKFSADAQAPLHYFGFPLESARVSGELRGSNVQLPDIEFAAADGQGEGRATLTGAGSERRLGFEVFVHGAQLARAVHATEEYLAARAGTPYVPSPEGRFVRQSGNSRIDLAFSAQGFPADIASFHGTGNGSVTGAELGEVRLFGLLSQILSGMSLDFSSLKLDAMRSSVELRDGVLTFPDLKVTGPSAVIDARGTYGLLTNNLNFNARFKPYDQPGSLLQAAVGLVMNPLTSILELKLTGAPADPKWSVEVSAPSSPFKTPTAAPAPPPATARPGG
jgi:hypothetical protein